MGFNSTFKGLILYPADASCNILVYVI